MEDPLKETRSQLLPEEINMLIENKAQIMEDIEKIYAEEKNYIEGSIDDFLK